MTKLKYIEVAQDFAKYAEKEVSFAKYIPSASKYIKSMGKLKGVGVGINADCLIIAQSGLSLAVYYKDIDL